MIELTDEILKKVITERKPVTHKGSYGRVLVIGGDAQYGGAVILAAEAAVYSGAGLVSVACNVSNHAALHARLPEAMVLDFDDKNALLTVLLNADVVLIGCGLGLAHVDLLKMVLTELSTHQKLIIDGSAITLFSQNDLVLKFPEQSIFTPHEIELQRLTGLKISEQSPQTIQEFTKKIGTIIVAKSHETKIFGPQHIPYVLKIGSAAQATGGMGDTLAGMISAFLAQFHGEKIESVAAATYLHSAIAHRLAAENYVVLPSQIIAEIPGMMKERGTS